MTASNHLLRHLRHWTLLLVVAFSLATSAMAVPEQFASVAHANSTSTSMNSLRNFRDASDSNSVLKPGVLYRSAEFKGLTAGDRNKLANTLQGGTIIDLRTTGQRKAVPDKSISGVKNSTIPITGILDQKPMVTDAKRRAQVGKALKKAANSDGPVLIHCVNGKDRTGWTVAMIMYVSGASDQEVMQEYMQSEQAFPGGVKESWLNSGLRAARSEYGSIPEYLKKGTGLTDSDIAKLRKKFQANASNGIDNKPVKDNPNNSNDSGPVSSSGKARFRIATYNIQGAGHTSAASTARRADRATDAIQGRTGSAAFDIVGVQEMVKGENQYNSFNKALGEYDHTNVPGAIPHTIYWKASKFKEIKSGKVEYPYFGSSNGDGVWVLLQSKVTGQRFYVFNHHPPAWGNFKAPKNEAGGALKRETTARIVSNWADKTRKETGLPIFILGDLNSTTIARKGRDGVYGGNRSRLPYCIYTASGLMHYSFDAKAGRMGPCPLKDRAPGFHIDHVLVSSDVAVVKTAKLRVPGSSDHNPVYADVVLGGKAGTDTPDGGGNDTSSAPKVTLITPADGIEVDKGLNLVAKATDADSGVAKVQFYRNGTRITTDRTGENGQYVKKWNTSKVPNGTYEVYAVAYDKSGNRGESAHARVLVNHGGGQQYPQVAIKQGSKKITVGFVGKCDQNAQGATATTPASLKSKEVVVGITFSSKCNKVGAGMNVEISLGQTYNNDTLRVYKQKGTVVTDITDKVAIVDMTNNDEKATYITYALEDGGDFDSDGAKNGTITDPVFVTSGEATNNTGSGDTTTTPNSNGTVTVKTPDGQTTTTNADGTVARTGVLPNTGTSAAVLLITGASVVVAVWLARRRRHAVATGLAQNQYTVADMVEAQQKSAIVVPSKKD